MKKNTKIISTILIIFSMILSLMTISFATSNANSNNSKIINTTQFVESSDLLSGIDKIIVKNKILVDGIETSLYKVFENPEKAIQDLKGKIPEFLSTLKEIYSLEELNDTNLKLYEEKAYQYISENKEMNESSKDFKILRSFMDIYENTNTNEEILKYYTQNQNSKSNDINLITLLPYDSTVGKTFNTTALNASKMSQNARAYNQNNAINYARQYAWNANSGPYHYFGIRGDCTNFTSQILEAAGVAQQVYDSEYSGWWHRKEWTGWHSHSVSWIQAATFARYMGIGYSTTDHYSFAANINTGDFIGLDFENDGDVDHCAFVVGKDNYVGGWGYYNYEVAQHSNNYLRWASDPENSWDTYSGSAKYVRIRR